MNQAMYKDARISKNRNFDGQFYFAVKTTGIFCRPSCPSPVAKEENVQYYATIFQAMDSGFRPCLRCRPDIHTDYYNKSIEGATIVEDGLNLIYEGYLMNHSIKDLSQTLFTSERNLRKLFVDHLGLSPVKVSKYHKGLFSRRLLLTSSMSVTEVAYAAGYNSIRQFNDMFRDLFKTTPSLLRKSNTSQLSPEDGLLIPYGDDFDFHTLIGFMKPRALTGIERIDDDAYTRTFRHADQKGYFTVRNRPGKKALSLTIHCDDVRVYMPIYHQVKRMFDLNTDFAPIHDLFQHDSLLAKGMSGDRVPRIPVAYNPFEFVTRAILGQVVSVAFATTLAIRLVERSNVQTPDHYPEGLNYFFPLPSELKDVDMTDMGMTKAKTATISNVIDALLSESLSLSPHQMFNDFHKAFIQLKGIGDWTVNYVAMRGLGMKDAFPYNDLGIIKALSTPNHKATNKEIKERAKSWAPYRAYATMCIWNTPH